MDGTDASVEIIRHDQSLFLLFGFSEVDKVHMILQFC